MNVIPVVFCFDKRIILGASVAIKSLIDCAKETTTYDIRVFHDDLSLENQKNVSQLVDNTRHTISFHYINSNFLKMLRIMSILGKKTYITGCLFLKY